MARIVKKIAMAGQTLNDRVSAARRVIILGAGPAGLGAAQELCRYGEQVTIVERHQRVGGLARTEIYRGFRFDIGGHRFFTKLTEVNERWHEILQDAFLLRPRLSRIFYRGRFFAYPLEARNAIAGLGLLESLRIVASYVRWHLRPYPVEETFEQWVTNRFGRRLFKTFFESYTEKVWGIPCSELRAEWAAQRIKGLSLRVAVAKMLGRNAEARSLIEEFHYPRLGPGMLWEAIKDRVECQGARVRVDTEVLMVAHRNGRVTGITVSGPGGPPFIEGDEFISTMPITELVRRLDPPAPAAVSAAASTLKHRDFVTVCLIVDKPALFPDNWIYIHDRDVRVARVQNFKNWSPEMVPDPTKTSLGLEYFCNRGDELWSMDDAAFIELAKSEIAHIGLAPHDAIEAGCVLRIPQAYPVYDSSYAENLQIVRDYLASFDNLRTIGRNGLHRYDNQDHAMFTGITAAREIALGEERDLWAINRKPEYQEAILDKAKTDH